MRINKFIASCGVASRRKAETLITDGKVTVNGNIVTELSFQVDEKKDIVKVNGEKISLEEKKIYIALNKPEGYITSVKDQFDRPSVLDLLSDVEERIFPVGRLDYETSGLIILTNDGDLTYKLTHPKHNINKVYKAIVKGIPDYSDIKKFKEGIQIEDYKTAPAKLTVTKALPEKKISVCEVTIHEGRNRQVRKMLRAINHPTLRLRRIFVGKIGLGDLEIGKFRYLTDKEIKYLKSIE
ncbi:MAG: rRNA pseudouridine synthase [Clostridioides sp.]|jgi:23S rRNA pseudouridine2605 synthase|nr:rRNA pseudouridine synthase [Clostridioides sp.]